MQNFTTQNFEVRPLGDVPVGYGLANWEVQRLADGSSIFFQRLTDALMYVEGVTYWDALSDSAREFWNMVANS
jgi:hypothetical protein